MAGSLAKAALAKGKGARTSSPSQGAAQGRDEALTVAIREAFAAVKSGDQEAFADAFEAAVDIKLSE